jgi:hypothetical protein
MTTFQTLLAAALIAPLSLTAPHARAEDGSLPVSPGLEEKARRALDFFGEQLRGLADDLSEGVDTLRDYGPPRVLPNGDILIPRLHRKNDDGGAPPGSGPDPDAKPAPAPAPDGETITL